jgi:GT2 family glycosyltransferase
MNATDASIVITTRNRKEDLRRAVSSALAQSAAAEVIVVDDASDDGTPDMIRAEFPAVRLERSDRPWGYIVQRNRAADLARGGVIVSIDDDAHFPSHDTVAQTLREFDGPRIGAVAMPYIDVRVSPKTNSRAPDTGQVYVTAAYVGTAHAVRRDLFRRLDGYRETLFHFGEERDFCARMLGAGYITRLGSADPIHHEWSPHREQSRAFDQRGRNQLLFPWHNTPMPYFPLHMGATIFNTLRFGITHRHPIWAARGVMRGLAALPVAWGERRPISVEAFRLSQLLGRRGAIPLVEIEHRLDPMAFPDLPWRPALQPASGDFAC